MYSFVMSIPTDECPLRSVRCLDVLHVGGFRLKFIAICATGDRLDNRLRDASLRFAESELHVRPTRHEHHGVGFLGVHDGEGENQVFLDLWINRNELRHTVGVSPKGNPSALVRPPEDHNSVCVWDLAVQAFEREAWLRWVLRNPAGPDLEAYMAERIDAML